MKKVWKIGSYILVAVLASVITLFTAAEMIPVPEVSKLDQLADLIEERFIGESDRTAMEDAAAAAMVDSLGDADTLWLKREPSVDEVKEMLDYAVGREQTNEVKLE